MFLRETSLTQARLRTLATWVWMRLLPYPRWRDWHEAGRLRRLELALLRGRLMVRSGIAARAWLSAAHFEPWGAQSIHVLLGSHEPMVQEGLRRSVPRGGVVFDLGANIGFMTLVAARLVGPTGAVVAFEPEPRTAAALRVNAALNGFDNVRVFEAAAGRADEAAELLVVDDPLWTRLASVGEHERATGRLQVPVVSLDRAIADGELPVPDVVKIDVEGAELDVVAGMRTTLEQHRPVVICEMHGKNEAFCALLESLGYRVVNLDGPEPVAQADGNVHAYCEPADDRSR